MIREEKKGEEELMNKKFIKPTDDIKCSFCGKNQSEVYKIIAGPGVYICNECIELSKEIIVESYRASEKDKNRRLPRPADINKVLDDYAIGQEQAKKIISVAIYNHYKRINHNIMEKQHSTTEVDIEKSNILLIGPTGTGKTLLAKTLAKILNVPFAIADATSLTEAGYVGEDVENILLRLIQNADNDIKRAEIGIIYVDEIDKIARKSGDNPSITRDVSGEGVQQGLLKIIEGTVANVPPLGGRKHPHQEFLRINTQNILFILGGAFIGLEDVVLKRIGGSSIGFNVIEKNNVKDEFVKSDILRKLIPDDLIKYGLIPEFVGRIPITAVCNPLTVQDLRRILLEPKNSLVKQYGRMFDMEGVKLTITPDAIDNIVNLAFKQKTGARGLRAIMENIMLEVMYDIPSLEKVSECIIDTDVVLHNKKPRLIYNESFEENKKLA